MPQIPGRRAIGLTLAALAIALCGAAWTQAGKPTPPPPPPPPPPPTSAPGIIYVQNGAYPDIVMQGMNGDGSGVFVDHTRAEAIAAGVSLGTPSSRTYHGERWWITHGGQEVDLFAYRVTGSGIATVQLTSIAAEVAELLTPSWSNDGVDSSIMFVGHHVDDGLFRLHRINVSALNLEDFGSAIPPATVNDLEVLYVTNNSHLLDFAQAPPPWNAVAFKAASQTQIVILDLETGAEFLIDVGMHIGELAWSPDGAHLAFRVGDPGSPLSIATVRPDGSDLQIVAVGGTSTKGKPTTKTYLHPHFSADGQAVLFAEEGSQGAFIDTVAADGGTILQLTSVNSGNPYVIGGWTTTVEAYAP